MSKFRTHYDNLKVARNAPDSIIRAAYKTLMQQYHPDKFEGSTGEALRISKIIKASFDVLIDPVKRAEHDRSIKEQERKTENKKEHSGHNSNNQKQENAGDASVSESDCAEYWGGLDKYERESIISTANNRNIGDCAFRKWSALPSHIQNAIRPAIIKAIEQRHNRRNYEKTSTYESSTKNTENQESEKPQCNKSPLEKFFVDNLDGTFTDTQTGLQWMRCCLGQDWDNFSCEGDSKFFTWQEASDAVKNLNKNGGFAGFHDWRLANIDELKVINKRIPSDAAQGVFPEIKIKSCWSSSLIENSIFAWCIDHYSNIDRDFTYKYFNAHLVRNIKKDAKKDIPSQYSFFQNKYNIFGVSFSKNELANLILIIGFPCLYFLLISLGYIENSYVWLLGWVYLISMANQNNNDLKSDYEFNSGSNIDNSNYDSWSDRSVKDKQKNSFSKKASDQDYSKYTRYVSSHFSKTWLLYFLAIIFAYLYIWKPDGATNSKPSESVKSYAKPAYIRPYAAPNGIAWPSAASYLSGYPKLNTDGLSSVTVDNHQNDSDVFVKLVSLDLTKPLPVRYFFIPAHGQFTLTLVTAGKYDIRYRDLNSGGFARSEAFSLSETETYTGIQYSNITMTLYKVAHGNMQTFAISDAEF